VAIGAVGVPGVDGRERPLKVQGALNSTNRGIEHGDTDIERIAGHAVVRDNDVAARSAQVRQVAYPHGVEVAEHVRVHLAYWSTAPEYRGAVPLVDDGEGGEGRGRREMLLHQRPVADLRCGQFRERLLVRTRPRTSGSRRIVTDSPGDANNVHA